MRLKTAVTSFILFFLPLPVLAEAQPPFASDLGIQLQALSSVLTAQASLREGDLPLFAHGIQNMLAVGQASDAASPLPRDLLSRLLVQLEPLARPDAASDPRSTAWRAQALATISLVQEKLTRLQEARPITAAAVPSNDDCAFAEDIGDGTVQGDTTEATPDGGASCGQSAGAPDVWYSYTAAADGVVVFSTFGSTLDTVLSLHSGCPTHQNLHELTCNDDAQGTLQSLVAHEVKQGETLVVRVSGFDGSTGPFALRSETDDGAITGAIRDSNGLARTVATARLYDDRGYYRQQSAVETDGSYLLAGLASGSYFVLAVDPALINEVWDDVPCFSCDVDLVGTPVTVETGLVSGIDFTLKSGGSITGVVVHETTGQPLSTNVYAYDSEGRYQTYVYSGSTGYQIKGLNEGSHFVRTYSSYYAGELYDDLPCSADCDVTLGTPVGVVVGEKTSHIDFALQDRGKISGVVTKSSTGAPISYEYVQAYGTAGYSERSVATNSAGEYVLDRLESGDHFVRTSSGDYLDQLYDGLLCEPSCDVTLGQPIPVEPGTTIAGIDFSLSGFGAVEGIVRAEDTGLPISSGCRIRLFDSSGQEVAYSYCGYSGFRLSRLLEGMYFATSDLYSTSGELYEDGLFDGLGCDPSCDATTGTPIPVYLNSTTLGVDLVLKRCPLPTRWDLDYTVVLSSKTWEACRIITAGNGFVIASPGHVVFRAREEVILKDGFSVQGGTLEVVVDPSVGE